MQTPRAVVRGHRAPTIGRMDLPHGPWDASWWVHIVCRVRAAIYTRAWVYAVRGHLCIYAQLWEAGDPCLLVWWDVGFVCMCVNSENPRPQNCRLSDSTTAPWAQFGG